MNTPHSKFLLVSLARTLLVVSAVFLPTAYAQTPAQLPLLTKSGTGVSPNIMLTLDDSGSLAFRHMPEDVFAGDTFVTPNPVNSQTVRWDQSDTYHGGVNFTGTVPGISSSTNYALRALRSSDTNTIYYNPENRYQPWFNDDGVTRRPNSPVSAAYLSPPLKATTASSITALTIATGSKTLSLAETGKSFTVAQTVVISSAAMATNWMMGSISAFNAGTGAMTVNVTSTSGSGTPLSWNVVQSGPTNAVVDLTNVIPMGTFTAGAFVVGKQYAIVSTGSTSFTAIGAINNSAGTVFTATGAGSGTGTASGSLVGIGSTNTTNRWCFALASNTSGTGTGAGGGCQAATGPFLHDPGVYFRLSKVNPTVGAGSFVVGTTYTILAAGNTSFASIGAANNLVGTTFTATGAGSGTGTASGPAIYSSITNYANYSAYSINAAAGTTYIKYPNRMDCAGTVCTQGEERQNFANWYTYYRDRNMMARGSLMEAFGPATQTVTAGSFVVRSKYSIVSPGTTSFKAIGAANNNVGTVFTATGVGTGTGTASGGTFRLGFGRINKSSATVDGLPTTVIESDAAKYGGGGVRDYNAARRVNVFKWLEDLQPAGGTPLVEALQADGEYYRRTDIQGPWTNDPSVATNNVADNATCRRSYTIMTTDGYWNGPGVSVGNTDNTNGSLINGVGTSYTYIATTPYSDGSSNTLADVAMYYWKTDLQPTVNAVPPSGDNISFWQNMTTFTVGLGVRGTLNPATDLPALTAGSKSWPAASSGQTAANVDDLWHAAVNSRGQFFSAKDPQMLATSIQTALAAASGGSGTTAGVATASTVLSASNRKYVPTFASVIWNGDITAKPLDSLGQVTTAVWSAAARMPLWSARNIVTWDSGLVTPAGVSFKWSSLSAPSQVALGTVAASYSTQFIDYLWGDHSQEGVGFPFRTRLNASGAPFILGDFVNANPVFVLDGFDGQYENLGLGGSGGHTYDPNYANFKTMKASRTAVLFAGSNDGMLHGFKDTKQGLTTDGQEVFAYVPRTVYPNLYKLTDKTYGETGPLQHQYFVDGPLREADAYVMGPGDNYPSWRNYLLGTLGAGGRAVYALDVTTFVTPLGPTSLRWEISDANDADIGYILAPVKVGLLPNGRWVAVFGNGYSSTNGTATLFVVDIENAASSNSAVRASAIQKLTVENAAPFVNGLGGVTLVHDANGRISNIYAGDLKGSLWKFDYTGLGGVNFAVSGSAALFKSIDSVGIAQPITSSPAVWNHAQGGYIVVFGTGKLFATGDAADTSPQSTYAVWDKPSDSVTRPLGRSNLASRSLTSFLGTGGASGTTFYGLSGVAVDWLTQRGWYIDLASPLPGGRVIYPTQVSGYDTALVSAVAPVQGTPGVCDSLSGTGINLLLPVQSGLNPLNHQLDTNGSGAANNSDAYAVGYGTAADGIDAVVHNQGIGISDKGGGGGESDCTGASCSAAGHTCVPSPLCPEANTCLASVQSATAGMVVCIPTGASPTPAGPAARTFDRVWRRIINPPIP